MRKVVLIVMLFTLFAVAVVMSQPPFPDEPPWHIEITGLDNFTLTSPTPLGTYSGSDGFTVGVNWPSGAIVSSGITAFAPALIDTTPNTNVVPTDVPQGITSCTVSASVNVALLDAPGERQATLTVTVTNKP